MLNGLDNIIGYKILRSNNKYICISCYVMAPKVNLVKDTWNDSYDFNKCLECGENNTVYNIAVIKYLWEIVYDASYMTKANFFKSENMWENIIYISETVHYRALFNHKSKGVE